MRGVTASARPDTPDRTGPTGTGPNRRGPGRSGPTGYLTVAYWLGATLVTLGAVATLSASLLGQLLTQRTDEEIEKFRGIAQLTVSERPAPDEECLILVLDAQARTIERYAGSPRLPAFPALDPAELDAHAARDRPVAVGSAYRALVVRVPDAGVDRRGTYIVIARSTQDIHRAVIDLLRIEGVVSLPLLGGVVAGARRLGRREARQRQEAERGLREFLAAAGHELRNPLTTISGYAQLARTGDPAYEQMREKALGRVAAEVERMDSLIDELVLLSRLDLGQPLNVQPVDLGQLCRDAVRSALDCHPGHPVRLLVAPGEHTVIGDPFRLHQLVANLLTNARVHTPEGTRATLGVGTEDGHRVIEVTDDGPGVPEEVRARVFDRFVRGEDPGAGSGLGLSIVAAVAAAHGGTVTLQPSDHGAWFRIRLPAAP
ncbi:sensor histidine kinase [Streptomyces sp. SAS_270]|uniref:sensor histidine kinase n=1 Tax=Streptomyces sp. SAS_270 TaxID=3412748 RepID=UPI00403CE441